MVLMPMKLCKIICEIHRSDLKRGKCSHIANMYSILENIFFFHIIWRKTKGSAMMLIKRFKIYIYIFVLFILLTNTHTLVLHNQEEQGTFDSCYMDVALMAEQCKSNIVLNTFLRDRHGNVQVHKTVVEGDKSILNHLGYVL